MNPANRNREAGIEREFYRVREFCAITGVSKAKVFQALHSGKLDAVKLEGTVLLTAESVMRYLDSAKPWKSLESEG